MALLRILTRSADRELALDAATALVDLHRELLLQSPDTPDSLRDLSISLNNVAGIQQQRGQLNEALDAYTEAMHWYALLDERYGPPFADPDELAALRDAVGAFPGTAQLDDRARRFTGAAGQAASTVMTPCRHSHGISF